MNAKNIFRSVTAVAAIVALATTSGNAQWQLTGNAATDTAVNFIGTTDAKGVKIKTNNATRMYIDKGGKIGIGTTAPSTALDLYSATTSTAFAIRSDFGSGFIFMDKQNATDNATVSYRTDGIAVWQTGTFANNDFAIKNLTLGNSITCLNSNNYVGMGTTTPSWNLDIRGVNPIMQIKSPAGLAAIIIDKGAAANNGYLIHRTAGVDKWTEGTIGNDNFSLFNWGLYSEALTVNSTNNFVGISNTAPSYLLDVQGSTTGNSFYNINSRVNYVGSSDIRGIYSYSVPADGWGLGIEATGGYYGGSFTNAGGAYAGAGYGVSGYASGTAGSRYGVYGAAYNSGGPAWAGYFAGNTYASNMVVGYTAPSSGYLLTVGGKIICTEVRVQLTPFPDYVFEKNYNLSTIEDVEAHVAQFHRLPGMPTACDVEENGMAVGEMQGKIVEKVEEQALYIIQLNNKIKELEKKMEALENANHR